MHQSTQSSSAGQVVTAEFPNTRFSFVDQSDSESERDPISATAAGLQAIRSGPDALVAVIPGNAPQLRPVIHNLLNCCPTHLSPTPAPDSDPQPSPTAAAQAPQDPSNAASPPQRKYSSHFAGHFKLAWQPNQPGAFCCTDGPILVARASFLSHHMQEALMSQKGRINLDATFRECARADPANCLLLSSSPHLLRPVTTRHALTIAEQELKTQLMAELGEKGVTFRDLVGTFLGPLVRIGRDSVIGPGVQLYGRTQVCSH